MNSLDQLSQMTKIVADTSDMAEVKRYQSVDVTTNPTLILKTLENGHSNRFAEFKSRLQSVYSQASGDTDQKLEECLLVFSVLLGVEILKLVPGRVSIEVPSHYSFDSDQTVKIAESIIKRFVDEGVDSQRVLIKIATTWEGIKSAQILERAKIHCNLTLVFSLPQAILCAENGVTLISPFVGRIYDWFKINDPDAFSLGDPGVRSVATIYRYLKNFDYTTEVMGASFRNIDQILSLAGCDLLTIAPSLLKELQKRSDTVEQKLSLKQARQDSVALQKLEMSEADFRWKINQDKMADEKLNEGIRIFHQDFEKQKALMQGFLLD